MSEGALTLISETQKWLETQGFPLEMRTAAEFRKAGFHVRQSGFYVDPDSGKNREIDVEAVVANYRGLVGVEFIVECKASTKPWVLLSSPDTLSNYSMAFSLASMTGTARHALIKHLEDDFHGFVGKIPWMKKEGLAGYSLRQAHSEKDSGYEAAIGVAKACSSRIGEEPSQKRIEFVFPVIVTNAPLIQCSLPTDGQLQLEEVPQGEFLFLSGQFASCIRVVTENYLPVFAKEAKSIADELQKEFNADGERLQQELNEKFGTFWDDDEVGQTSES
jgi:hypothetical protein